MSEIREHLNNIIRKNIGPVRGSFVVVYDTESLLAETLMEGYYSVLPTRAVFYHFGSPNLVENHGITSDELKEALLSLPTDSLVILIQSTNFRLTDFRIRLELFQRGIHCVEHNHLGYIADEHIPHYIAALEYRTPLYTEATALLNQLSAKSKSAAVSSPDGAILNFGALEVFRGNTGNYENDTVK